MSGLLETAQYLQTHNCSFVRFGDGEALIMNGSHAAYQSANENLAKEMLRVFLLEREGLMQALPNLFSGYAPMTQFQTNWWYKSDKYRQFFLKHANLTKQYLNTQISHSYVSAGDHCTLLELIYSTLREVWRG